MTRSLKFIDLFAGLGGFNIALSKLGHTCVLASEIDPGLRDLYKHNHNIEPKGDIRAIRLDSIPDHDILCAGFPCQPFSKAGKMMGRRDNTLGTMFDDIVKILTSKKPRYFILENVPFIKSQDNALMWDHMQSEFERIHYKVDHKIYSPHQIGVPQHRNRIYIVGSRIGLTDFKWPKTDDTEYELDIKNILDSDPDVSNYIGEVENRVLDVWRSFMMSSPNHSILPKPFWAMEADATYPFSNDKYPAIMDEDELGQYRGAFGMLLQGYGKSDQLAMLPSYARDKEPFKNWKQRYIARSRQFILDNDAWIYDHIESLEKLGVSSWQKLEWNVPRSARDLNKYIVQFRASGIRVKATEFSPSLVCGATQIPILAWDRRYISITEGLRLQSMEGLQLPQSRSKAFHAIGNAVNVDIVGLVARALLHNDTAIVVPLKSKLIKRKPVNLFTNAI